MNSKFLELQWEMYNRYFSRKIELIDQIQEIKDYKDEIFNYNQWLEIAENEFKYTNFTNEKFDMLQKIELQIVRKKANNSMVLVEEGPIHKSIRIIKKIILKPKSNEAKKEY